MLNASREFRSLILSSRLSVSQVIKRIGNSENGERFSSSNNTVHQGFYYSETAYMPPELLEGIRVRKDGGTKYRYCFFAASIEFNEESCILISVPFSRMAYEFFSPLDNELPDRSYKRVDLQKLVPTGGEIPPYPGLALVTSVRFRLSGGDTADSISMQGPDVLGSKYFRRTGKALKGVLLRPERMRFKMQLATVSTSITADSFGNFWFRLRKDGGNLGSIVECIKKFNDFGLLRGNSMFPVDKTQDPEDEVYDNGDRAGGKP